MCSKVEPQSQQKIVQNKVGSEKSKGPSEARQIHSKNVCLCLSIEKNENIFTPSQLEEDGRKELLEKLLDAIGKRWKKTPLKIIIGKKTTPVQVEGRAVMTNPWLFQFQDEIKSNQKTRFALEANGCSCIGYLINYGSHCGPYIEDVFTAEFGFNESYTFKEKILQKETFQKTMDPKGLTQGKAVKKNNPVQKIAQKKRNPQRISLSNEEKIQKLKSDNALLEKEIERLELEIKDKDETIKELQTILKKYQARG